MIREVLRNQNTVDFFSVDSNFGLRHTNLKTKFIMKLFLIFRVLFVLLDNLRHSKNKRYSLIVCSGDIFAILKKIGIVSKNYNLIRVDKGFNLCAELKQIEKYKKFAY